jgi:uncharacterized membrane protein YqiK
MQPIFFAVGTGAVVLFGLLIMFAKFYRKIEQGSALIVNTMRAEPTVTFTGCMVYPIIHKAELMDISVKTIEIDRSGNEGLICRDNIRADIKVKFFVRVNKTAEDVLKVAQGIGCTRASNHEILEDLFSAKFSEALKTVGKAMDFVDLYQARDNFRDEIIRQIGDDLSGYVLEDAAIDYLEQTPLSKLDASNILDAQGIKKITELTATESVRTNELRRNEEMQIKKKNVETQEALLELDRQQADATARQHREIATVKAREEAETAKIQAEERAKSEMARLQTDQMLAVQQENALREKEVAENNRKRAVAIEEEKVTRARELEVVDREKEVALQRIDKERAIEVQKKAIADVVRERIVVERTVAEQEEAIKELRTLAEAERTRKSTVILAEGQAEEKLIVEVKEAEAQERRARHKAAEEVTLAEARLKVAEKGAESKKREAEGTEAYAAAPGLAAARVMMVTAEATQKQGLAEAQVISAKSQAEAHGLKAKLEAEAQGNEKLGLAQVAVRTAAADATTKAGHADAEVIQARFSAEAKGLQEKFEAMKAMSPETREHEEFRMRLEKLHTENMKGIEAQTDIAGKQAELLGKAIGNAKIEMVGGDGAFFDKYVQALSVGKGIDAAIAKSQTLQIALKDHLNGERNAVDDMQKLMGALGGSAAEVKDLTLASLLAKANKDLKDSGRKAAE